MSLPQFFTLLRRHGYRNSGARIGPGVTQFARMPGRLGQAIGGDEERLLGLPPPFAHRHGQALMPPA
jgi:hypothetical protein